MIPRLAATCLFAAALFGCLGNRAMAAPIASDDFETGNFSGGSGWAQASWDIAGPTTVVDAALTYASGEVVSNGGAKAAQYVADSTGTSPFLDRSIASTTLPIYYSFLIQKSANVGTNEDFFGAYPLRSGISDTDADDYGMVLRLNGANQNFGIRSDDGGEQNFVTGANATTGSTHLIVVKLERLMTEDSMTIWVDPDSTTEAGGTNGTRTATDSGGNDFGSPNNLFDELNFRTALQESGDAYLIDNVLIGTTFSDVVVPEPGTLVLAVLGTVGLVGVARRRKISNK